MKLILLLACAISIISCTTPAFVRFQPDSWNGKPNPLDDIAGEQDAETLHRDNIRAITGNPSYQMVVH